MPRQMDLNDPRLKGYLNSLDEKYRKILEKLYPPQEPIDSETQLRKTPRGSRGGSNQKEEGV